MAFNAGGLKFIASNQADLYVSINVGTSAVAATVYSDAAVTTTTTNPVVITQGTSATFYVLTGGTYTLSVNYGAKNGPQVADPRTGQVLTVDLQAGELGVFDYSLVTSAQVSATLDAATTFGLMGQSYPIDTTSGTNVFATGVLQLMKVYSKVAGTVSNIEYNVGVVGATLTAAQNLVGLYSAPGVQGGGAGVITLIGTAPDQSTAFTVLGQHAAALTAVSGKSLLANVNTQFYVGALSVGTTPVSFCRGASLATAANYNVSAAAGTAHFLTSGSALTALPATVTLSGGTISVAQWAGIS